jgi:hypothetical protein
MSNTLSITLKIDESEKIFVTTPKGRSVRNAAALSHRMKDESLTPAFMDELAAFVVDLYNGQFTVDDLYDGLDAGGLGKALIREIDNVVNMFYQKAFELPNAEAGRQ